MCGHNFTGTSTDKKATVDGLNVWRRLRCTSYVSFFLIELLFPQTKCRLQIPVLLQTWSINLRKVLNSRRANKLGRREYCIIILSIHERQDMEFPVCFRSKAEIRTSQSFTFSKQKTPCFFFPNGASMIFFPYCTHALTLGRRSILCWSIISVTVDDPHLAVSRLYML